MLAFAAGDEGAFETLFARWSRPLLRYLERLVSDAASAEELLQESFLRVYRARERYRPEARFSTWLYRIATNLAWNELRRPRRRDPHESMDAPEAAEFGSDPEVDAQVDARRVTAEVDAALRTLPERQRSALWLASVEGLSYAEVAEALDTSEKAVKALVHRGRSTLASKLGRVRGVLADSSSGAAS